MTATRPDASKQSPSVSTNAGVMAHDGVPLSDEAVQLRLVLSRDERGWSEFVRRYDPPLREVIHHAARATAHPLTPDQVDDVMSDFWVLALENDLRLFRAFNPARGASLLTWLTFHVAQVAFEHVRRAAIEPEFVPLDRAPNVPDLRCAPTAKLRAESRVGTIDDAIRECVRTTVLTVVREELANANRKRDIAEADHPRSAASWAKQLGCSAESLVKRVKRGSLECVRIGSRYYFTRAQIEGSRRWQRAK